MEGLHELCCVRFGGGLKVEDGAGRDGKVGGLATARGLAGFILVEEFPSTHGLGLAKASGDKLGVNAVGRVG